MTKAASEGTLAKLHSRVAEVMLESLESRSTAWLLLAEYKDDLPDDVVEFLSNHSQTPPQLLTACTKFLKDNEITCQPDDDAVMSELHKRLEDKRSRIKGIPVTDPTIN